MTRATKQVYDILESENIVMVIGHSGSGKSAIARNAALQYHSKGYDVVPVEYVDKILEYRCKLTKQFFVIDDVVGKYSIDGSCLYHWERLDSKLKALIIDHNVKLICTLRKVLATDPKFRATKTLLNEKAHIIDLDQKDNYLLSEEKVSVLNNHLTCTGRQGDLSDEECRECCKSNFAFPLLCNVFTTSDGLFQCKSSFFRKPFSFLNEEITKLHQQNKEVYCSLVICMIYYGKLSKDIFSDCDRSKEEQDKIDRILGMISEACGLHRNISRQTLLDSLISVEGVYIKICSGNINFLHDSFLEAVSFHFSKVNICILLEFCNTEFLRERIRVISPNVDDDQNVIVLEEESYFNLACRIIIELKKGSFEDILWSQPIRQDRFLKVISNVIDCGHMITKQKLLKLSSHTNCDGTFFAPVNKQGDCIKEFGTTMVRFPADNALIHWVICTGCHNFFEYLWKSMSQKTRNRYVRGDKSIFPLSLLSGCKEIIKLMLESGADVKSPGSQYALQHLLNNERNTELIELLIRNGIGMNFIDYNGKSPLFYAITNNNLSIQALLVEKDSQQNPLHEAVYNSNIHKTKYNLCSRNIRFVSNNGWSMFHFAVYNNDIPMMKLIYKTAMKRCNTLYKNISKTDIVFAVDKRDNMGWTPLHLAIVLCKYEAVDFLIHKITSSHSVYLDVKTSLNMSSNGRITCSLLEKNNQAKQHTRKNIKECISPVNDERRTLVDEDVVKEITENMENWEPTLFSLIYVTFMNILFFCFSIVMFRKKIDIPEWKGNTPLHAAATMESEDDSIESVKMLLKRGANPLFYNINGDLPADVSFYRSPYKVKFLFDTYSRNAVKRSMWILVIISILIFLLAVFLCLAPIYISPDYVNVNVYINNNSYDASTCNLYDYSNGSLHGNLISYKFDNLALENNSADNQQANFLLLYVIHLLTILCVLCLDIILAIRKKILLRQTYHFENIYICVHSLTIIHIMFICFPFQSIGIVIKDLIVFVFVMYLYGLGFAKLVMLTKRHNAGWYVMTTVFYKIMFYIFFPALSLIFLFFFGVLLSRISFMFETLFNYSMMSLFSTFIVTFIGMYIYMNVFSSCAYLIFLKITDIRGFFKTRNTLPIITNIFPFMKSCMGHIIFKFCILFILLIIESVAFYDKYQEGFIFLKTTKPFDIMVIFSTIDQFPYLDVFLDILHFILAGGLLKILQRYMMFTTDLLIS